MSAELERPSGSGRFTVTMYVFLKRLWDRSKPIVARYFWVFIGYFLSQVGVQILNLLTGFAIVRNLSKDEYAIYTIINTLGPVLLILSDNGIGNSIMALGRQFWQDADKWGSLDHLGLALRLVTGQVPANKSSHLQPSAIRRRASFGNDNQLSPASIP